MHICKPKFGSNPRMRTLIRNSKECVSKINLISTGDELNSIGGLKLHFFGQLTLIVSVISTRL